jgi:hypothetical protein
VVARAYVSTTGNAIPARSVVALVYASTTEFALGARSVARLSQRPQRIRN